MAAQILQRQSFVTQRQTTRWSQSEKPQSNLWTLAIYKLLRTSMFFTCVVYVQPTYYRVRIYTKKSSLRVRTPHTSASRDRFHLSLARTHMRAAASSQVILTPRSRVLRSLRRLGALPYCGSKAHQPSSRVLQSGNVQFCRHVMNGQELMAIVAESFIEDVPVRFPVKATGLPGICSTVKIGSTTSNLETRTRQARGNAKSFSTRTTMKVPITSLLILQS